MEPVAVAAKSEEKSIGLVVRGAKVRRPLQVLDKDDAIQVDAASMEILQKTGIRFHDQRALREHWPASLPAEVKDRLDRILVEASKPSPVADGSLA